MTPAPPVSEQPKSWKKINEERKLLKKKRKQEKLLKSLEKSSKLEELTKNTDRTKSDSIRLPSTVSIAVPGSILENAQSVELRSYVAGQIARAACIFRVNEVIVFDDVGVSTARETARNYEADLHESHTNDKESAAENGVTTDVLASQTVRKSSLQLARILQYLECPQYLRKFFFPLHKDLKYTGLLNPLDAPHHLRQQNVFLYREGVVSDRKAREGHSHVNVGFLNEVLVNEAIEAGVRVTIKLDNHAQVTKKLRGTVVSPDEPRQVTGVYWGYNVRIAHSFSEIFTGSPYADDYDLTIGTSDRGTNVHEVPSQSYSYNHLLIVFGGLKGIETAIANDDKLNIEEPALLFDHYVNVLPKQGSRTIRTEEALLIALASLQDKLCPQVPDVQADLSEFLPCSADTGVAVGQEQQQYNNNETAHKHVKRTNDVLEDADSNKATKERNRSASAGNVKRKLQKDTTCDSQPLPAIPQRSNEKASAGLDDLSRFD